MLDNNNLSTIKKQKTKTKKKKTQLKSLNELYKTNNECFLIHAMEQYFHSIKDNIFHSKSALNQPFPECYLFVSF